MQCDYPSTWLSFQYWPSSVTYLAVLQLFINPSIVTQPSHRTHNLGVHLWGQSFHQLRNKFISHLATFFGNNLDRDEITWPLKHFLQFFLKAKHCSYILQIQWKENTWTWQGSLKLYLKITAHKRKGMKTGSAWTWMISCIVSTLPLEELESSAQVTGWDTRTVDVVTKGKIPFLSEIKLVLSTPQPVTHITMVCRTTISIIFAWIL